MRLLLALSGIGVTALAYALSRVVGKRYPSPLTSPVFFSTPLPASIGLAVGSLSTLVIAVVVARLFDLPQIICASVSIKSVTAPVAIELAPMVNGDSTLAAAFVIATGIIGAMLGPWLMDKAGIHAPLARGLALGTISHGQGTAEAVVEGEVQGAAAGIAMVLAAILASFFAPILVPVLLR